MKNIIVINYLAIAYTIVVSLIAYLFFRDFATWTILGAMVALFNHSLLVRFSKNKVHKDTYILLIVLKYVFYLIVLGYMFFQLREDSNLLMYSYIFFLVGALNIKMGIFMFHLPIPKFVEMRKDEEVVKDGDEEDASTT